MKKEQESNAQASPVHGDKAYELSEKELEQVSGGAEAPRETVTFEYGGLHIEYVQQKPY